ncbi:MAG: hypothetical protein L6Q99_07545 [Planctomycetes bacterium]|nr:hypothetical protein [Planctomycetota bacterium]
MTASSCFAFGARMLLASSAFLGIASLAAADSSAPGYALGAPLAKPAFGAAHCFLANGDQVTFDGLSVERWTSTGSFVATLATLPAQTWSNFVAPTADGSTVYFSESSNHGVYRASTDGSGWAALGTVLLAYDGEVGPDGQLYLSAQPFGSGPATHVVRFQTSAPFTWTSIGSVPGASGPLTFDATGRLYYATQDTVYPAAPGSTDVLRWSATQVAAGGLDLSNATLFGADFDGGSALDFDDKSGELLIAETNDGVPLYRVATVKATKAASPTVVSAGQWISSVQLVEQGGAATFDPYQPNDGTALVYSTTDWWSFDELRRVVPARPVLTASGAGTSGQGPVTMTVTGGVPNGTLFLFFCPVSAYSPIESVYNLPAFLFFTGLTPNQVRRVPFLLPTDANGTGSFTFWNPGDLQGQYAFQALVGGATGAFVGASTAALF